MTDEKNVFTLSYERFNEFLSNQHWFNLQHEFEKAGYPLSQSFLIWRGETGSTWVLADFETKKTYDIKRVVEPNKPGTETEPAKVEISGPSSQEEQLIGVSAPEAIFSLLQKSPQGTHEGFIDFVTKLDFVTIDDLEQLKRSEFSDAGFSFESVHHNLSIIHKMIHEILTAPRESLHELSRNDFQQFTAHLTEFYKKIQGIGDFDPRGERPQGVETLEENHSRILVEISGYCETVRDALSKTLTYLRSKKVEQLENQVKTTLTDAEGKFNTETEKIQQIGEESQQKEEKRQESFDELYIQLQNQLTEKPISQYKAIFNDEAEKHQKNAKFWMIMAIAATAVFFSVFILLSLILDSGGTQLTGFFQNLFTKGFILSPIYVWLNRSIKNYTAEKHLEVINTHRQNALETVDPFLEATKENRDTRDQILLAATKTIYDANQSGYLSTKTSSSDSASPVQQIIKEVIPTKSSGKDD